MTTRNRNKALFGEIVRDVRDGDKESLTSRRAASYLMDRANRLGELASGELMEKTLYWVDPERCRMWMGHNRRYDLLNEDRCADLIEGIKAQGRQEFPAIVRTIADDPAYDYEVICGARRHWAISWLRNHNYQQFKFLIDVRELTDEEAFRLSDIENRDREDISDYERALDYKKALSTYYRTQKEMAERLEVSEGWLSKYLDLCEMPEEIVACYPDVTHIRVRHWVDLKPLIKRPANRQVILEAARELKEQQENSRSMGEELKDGQEVIRILKAASENKKPRNQRCVAQYRTRNRMPLLTVSRDGRHGYVFRISLEGNPSDDELRDVCKQAIEEQIITQRTIISHGK